MKHLILCLSVLILVGCGDTKVIDGVEYDTYGFINQDEKHNPDIEYELAIDSIAMATCFVETLIVPIYVFGFDLYEPVGVRDHSKPKGSL